MEIKHEESAEHETNAERAGTKTDTEAERLLLARAKAARGAVVYFIASGNFVKIGTSRDLKRRLYTVRVATPEPACLIGIIEGGADKESEIHSRLGKHHHRGEWFRMHDDITRLIERKGCSHASYRNWILSQNQP